MTNSSTALPDSSGDEHPDTATLDGHTINELADYLDAGREPRDPGIESSPACQHALAALRRLRTLRDQLTREDEQRGGFNAWLTQVMALIPLSTHDGADIPLPVSRPDRQLVITEGALRALIRAAGDHDDALLVGRVLLNSSDPSNLEIDIEVTVVYGRTIPSATDRLRERVREVVDVHTGLTPIRIGIAVRDLSHIPEVHHAP